MIPSPGTKLGPYEIVAPLGAGALGEVYRARDTRLGRVVAVKVLRGVVGGEAFDRFSAEARASGQLNHPNILAIYDFGSQDGTPYIVCELLEGETLRERLERGPLPPAKALECAAQIASALAAAHAKGLAHRDLKPGNVFLTQDGRVKVLDFGLARRSESVASGSLADAATNPSLVEEGGLLGTPGYSAPEQVRGGLVDHRSDIFSLGAVLYEMLTGRRAFEGPSVVETLHATLKEDPPEPPRPLPPAAEALLRHCLEKSPDERFQSARDIALYIEGIGQGAGHAERPAGSPMRSRGRALIVGLCAVALGAGAATVGSFLRRTPTARYHQLTFRRGAVLSARFAPDGQTIVYGAAWGGMPARIFSTRPESPEARDLGLPDGDVLAMSRAGEMALSLGRQFVAGFTSLGTLARAPFAGGAPRELLPKVEGADWSPDGRLAAARAVEGRYLLEFPQGNVVYQTVGWISSPRISRDGTRVAFIEHPLYGDDRGAVCVIGPDGQKRVLSDGWSSLTGLAWSPHGDEIWFTAAEVGANCDLRAVDLAGRVRLIAASPARLTLEDVDAQGRALVTESRFRLRIALKDLASGQESDLSWHDGSVLTDLSDDGSRILFDEEGAGAASGVYAVYLRRTDGSSAVRLGDGSVAALSPDGRWAAVVVMSASPTVALLPTGAGDARTLESGGIASYEAVAWMPDGERILFAGNEAGKGLRLYEQAISGGPPRPLPAGGLRFKYATRPVSPDGRFVAVLDGNGRAWLLPLDGGEPRPIAGLERGEEPMRWGGDGRSLYVSRTGELPCRVYRLDLATGLKELLAELAPFDRAGVQAPATIQTAKDGRLFAYTYAQSLSDLFLVEGLR